MSVADRGPQLMFQISFSKSGYFFQILNSYDGYGTDAVIYLKSSTSEANELLPIFNKTSTRQYKSAIPAADWTDPASSMNRYIMVQSCHLFGMALKFITIRLVYSSHFK